jgi:ceramide glucosyltransferase
MQIDRAILLPIQRAVVRNLRTAYQLMNHLVRDIALLGTLASIGYCLVAIWAAIRFARTRETPIPLPLEFPPISILKPLKGTDPQMYAALRSHCLQNYPCYEMLFGVSDANDPAIKLVQKLQQEFPQREIQLVGCDKALGANGKVSSLAQLAAVAKYDYLLVNDSDIRVEAEYLRTVLAELQQADVGLVTCLYRGVPSSSIGSQFESLGISTDFVSGVLVARQIEDGLHFGLGSTLALRKSDLEAIGGFEAIADYLADDYELGRRITGKGLKVALSRSVVDSFLPEYSFSEFFSHQLRWARTIRASRPAGYAGLLLTLPLPWALLTLALARGADWALALFVIAVLMRLAVAVGVGDLVLKDRELLPSMWLLPIRDLLAVFVWIGGLAGREIVWRGERFHLQKGKLQRLR